jgi:hypothetical protein
MIFITKEKTVYLKVIKVTSNVGGSSIFLLLYFTELDEF